MNRRSFFASIAAVPMLKAIPAPAPIYSGFLDVERHMLWCRANNRFILPFIDGKKAVECRAADSVEGWVECYDLAFNGATRKYYGKVEWREQPWPKGWTQDDRQA